MPDDYDVTNSDAFLRLSKALKNAGRTDMRKQLNKRLRTAVKPLTPKTRAAALAQLPKHGGLNEAVAKAPQRVAIKTGNDPGISLVVGTSKSGARGADEGEVRHPVFGHKDRYVSQRVTPGWFTNTVLAEKSAVQQELGKALDDVVDLIVKEAGGG